MTSNAHRYETTSGVLLWPVPGSGSVPFEVTALVPELEGDNTPEVVTNEHHETFAIAERRWEELEGRIWDVFGAGQVAGTPAVTWDSANRAYCFAVTLPLRNPAFVRPLTDDDAEVWTMRSLVARGMITDNSDHVVWAVSALAADPSNRMARRILQANTGSYELGVVSYLRKQDNKQSTEWYYANRPEPPIGVRPSDNAGDYDGYINSMLTKYRGAFHLLSTVAS